MRGIIAFIAGLMLAGPGFSDSARVAVAANFLVTAEALAKAFTLETGHEIELVSGATGALYAQIRQGAPYDIFLSADAERVAMLEDDGRLAPGGRKVYALGRLVLFAADPEQLLPDVELSLRREGLRHFAMADPALAPYGLAAREVMTALGLEDVMQEKAVIGANVGQTFAFVATGNAELGFVALSQAMDEDGAWFGIPDTLYAPILQEAGLLARAGGNPAAQGFFEFLASAEGRAIIVAGGYGVDE